MDGSDPTGVVVDIQGRNHCHSVVGSADRPQGFGTKEAEIALRCLVELVQALGQARDLIPVSGACGDTRLDLDRSLRRLDCHAQDLVEPAEDFGAVVQGAGQPRLLDPIVQERNQTGTDGCGVPRVLEQRFARSWMCIRRRSGRIEPDPSVVVSE